MGIFIYLFFVSLFVYGIYLTRNTHIHSAYYIVGFFLMIFQLLSVLGNINVPYTGYSIDYYSFEFMYYIGFVFFYVGYFIWAVIALLLVYIPFLVNFKKHKTINETNSLANNLDSDNELDTLINKLEKENKK